MLPKSNTGTAKLFGRMFYFFWSPVWMLILLISYATEIGNDVRFFRGFVLLAGCGILACAGVLIAALKREIAELKSGVTDDSQAIHDSE